MEAWTNLTARRARPLGRLVALAALLSSAGASAQLPRVAVSVGPSCPQLDESALRRVLEVEIGAAVELSEGPDAASAAVTVSCEGELARLVLVETPSETPRRLEREVDLAGMRGPSRLVALAIAELIAASWVRSPPAVPAETEPADPEPAEPATEPEAAPEAPEPAPTEPTAEEVASAPGGSTTAPAPTEPRTVLGVRAFALLGLSGDPLHGWGGGGVGLDVLLVEPLVLRADLRAAHGTLDAAGLGAVADTRASAAVLLALRAQMDAGHLDVGAGVRAGVGVLAGAQTAPAAGRTLVGPTLDPVLAADLSVALAAPLHLHLGVEAGWTVLGVAGTEAATGAVVARIGGPAATLSLGLELRP